MKLVAMRKQEQNLAWVDPWSVVHFAAGLAAGLVNIPRDVGMGLAVGYELAEQLVERDDRGQRLFDTTAPEIVPNVLVDLALFAAGQYLGRRWNRSD